jgi:hypothetical protein
MGIYWAPCICCTNTTGGNPLCPTCTEKQRIAEKTRRSEIADRLHGARTTHATLCIALVKGAK